MKIPEAVVDSGGGDESSEPARCKARRRDSNELRQGAATQQMAGYGGSPALPEVHNRLSAKVQRRRYGIARKTLVLKQKGVILIIALIALVAMTLAGIALVRSVDTSAMVAGNLAFKQSGIASGDAGVEAAINWLTENGGSLTQDVPASGYYATSQDCLDLTGNGNVPGPPACSPPFTVFNWSNASAIATLAEDAAGNRISYVIHRLCNSVGALNGSTCTVDQAAQDGNSRGGARQMLTYQPGSWNSVANRGYYRITVRVAGPRNSVSYVQAIVSR